jgi:excisionase family DNA binding protein
MSTPAPESETVSYRTAARKLRIGERRLQQLIKAHHLGVTSNGHGRRITAASLEIELSRRKPEMKAEICTDLQVSVSEIRTTSLPNAKSSGENQSVNMVMCDEPPAMLLPITQAAILVGVSDRLLRRAIEDGQLAAVAVGARRLVNREVLLAWARGERRSHAEFQKEQHA